MRYKAVIDTIGWILILFSFTLFLPMITGYLYNEELSYIIISYFIPFIIALSTGILLRYTGRGYSEALRDREAFAVVGIGWLVIAFLGCLPFIFSGTIPNIISAYFESMSGFTTTGATVLEVSTGDYLDKYSHSIFLWRALIQWLGGMGIIVLSVVILARIFGAGMQLLRAEVPGPTITKGHPDAFYDAVCHTFTTLATGGFGTHTSSIGFYDSPIVDIIIISFMLIAGTNFVLHYQLLTGKIKNLFRDPEFRFYILIIGLGTIFVTGELAVKNVYTIFDSFRYGLFQVTSITTTTGYATADFGSWPAASQFILLLLMFVGGCAGSTGGSIKVGCPPTSRYPYKIRRH